MKKTRRLATSVLLLLVLFSATGSVALAQGPDHEHGRTGTSSFWNGHGFAFGSFFKNGWGKDRGSDSIKKNAKALSISGIDAPTDLTIGETGTWTVDVKSKGADALQYAVVWGDENTAARSMSASSATQSSATFTHTYDVAGTYTPTFTVTDKSGRTVSKSAAAVTVHAEAAAHISGITPATGPAGSTVTVSGYGFADSDVYLGSTKIDTASITDDGTLSFVVPAATAIGTYAITIDNGNGVSNSVDYTVTAAASSRLSVNGIDAPTTLAIGEDGTWTVNASSRTSGNLKYSVVWGDENFFARAMQVLLPETMQSSATFAHAYDAAGTYTPTFTVTDETGRSVSVKASVVVK